jgi:transcriptional antiterminator NusG
MLENNMKDQRDRLYSVGDFVGCVECVGKHRRQEASEKKWRLMQVSDKLSSGDVRLLDRMQIEIYRPLVRSIRLVPRNKLSRAQRRNAIRPVSEKVEPFFPGYAFFSFSETDEHWREVFKMVGVRGLVCANNRPVDVPWNMIREIQAQEVGGAVPSETKLSEFAFLIGDHVRVRSGPFASFGGTIVELPKGLKGVDLGTITLDELDESYRVHLLVDIFGRPTPVELPVSEIEKM